MAVSEEICKYFSDLTKPLATNQAFEEIFSKLKDEIMHKYEEKFEQQKNLLKNLNPMDIRNSLDFYWKSDMCPRIIGTMIHRHKIPKKITLCDTNTITLQTIVIIISTEFLHFSKKKVGLDTSPIKFHVEDLNFKIVG